MLIVGAGWSVVVAASVTLTETWTDAAPFPPSSCVPSASP